MSLFYAIGKLLCGGRLSICEEYAVAKRSFAADETGMENGKGDSIDLLDSRYDRYWQERKIGNEERY